MFRFIAILPIFFFTVAAYAQEPVGTVTAHISRLPVNEFVQFLEDPEGKMTFETVLQDHGLPWRQDGREVFNRGYSRSTWWLKLRLKSQLKESNKHLLEIAYAVLDHVDVAIVQADGRVDRFEMGDKLPFRMRPVKHRYFVVPILLRPDEPVTVYVRLRSSSSIQAPMTVWEEDAFFDYNSSSVMINGFYFGTVMVIALYNLLMYFGLGERVYLYYVLYVASMGLFLASLGGHAFQYLWPGQTEWNDQAIIVFLAGVVVFGLQFTRNFLSLKRYSPFFNRVAVIWTLLGLAMMVSAFCMPYKFNIVTLILLACVAIFMGLVMGGYTWKKGEPTAKYYCTAWVFMFSGGLLLALSKFHLLPSNTFTEHAIQIGSSLEMVLLSFALAERINVERRLRFEAQTATLETQMKVNEVLEQRVQQRTEELEQANRRLQELSETDQLTGLNNRRFLQKLLERELARSRRYEHDLSVLMIDVDHFKRVNDLYGHLTGDLCLQSMAGCIKQASRHMTDTAARYGGEEFCVVLPETDLAGAMVVAERIRNKIQVTPVVDDDLALKLTVSIGVACMTAEDNLESVDQLLQTADAALYQSKADGRNRVTAGHFQPAQGLSVDN